jgi:tetraacyldisaccharide 4'-kinase
MGTLVYAALHKIRQACYRLGLLRSHKFPCPVVSVGNITAGGTGKTPFVEYLARWFARKNYRVAILARGYGRINGQDADDEDLVAGLEFENVIRLTGRDRVALGHKALADHRADLLILDDGFQHYPIRRSLDIVMIDATRPFANGWLIPRGLLRERPSALRRADLLVLTRTDQAPPGELDALRKRIGLAVETVHRPVHVHNLWNRKKHVVEWLRDRNVYAFCGVGNPDAFLRTLESVGARVVRSRVYEDHHLYDAQDLRRMNAEAREFMAEIIVTTEKDATKVAAADFEIPLASLRVEIEVVLNEDLLDERLLAVARDIPRAVTPIGR